MGLLHDLIWKYGTEESGGGVEIEALNATENKTYNAPDGKAYNPVTVNVESDYSTAQVTINPTNARTVTLPIPVLVSTGSVSAIVVEIVHGGDRVGTYAVPLYKGLCVISVETEDDVSVSGDCEYEDGQVIITGDCSITFQLQE